MQTLNSIRSGFLDFFKRNGHEVRPSGSLVPHNDPTLMFTNAGMNQFKNVFTGAEKLPFVRATTSQKCVRAGGKHNDLDNVGYTARHHTFFEMLGNFSFGDYFKEEAIKLAWDLLTKDFGIKPEKLTVTIYHDDDAAFDYWKKISGFPDHKIIRIATNDNFWAMGETGPCGPCSEIFYDHGEHIPGGPPGSAQADGDRFVEIWNLVFMQYEQLAEGKRINLPKPSIDTGMGLERIAAVMQGVHSNYDIDLFQNLIHAIEEVSGFRIQDSEKDNLSPDTRHLTPAAYKVIADHLRSSCFLIADGVLPSNEGRGYVLRRIMRRAMRYAHQMGCKEPLMYKLVPSLVGEMGNAYPELKRAEASITDNLRQEEERFKQTLERGLKLLEDEVKKLSSSAAHSAVGDLVPHGHKIPASAMPRQDDGKRLPGEIAFKLYDTYGFPLDLTQDILRGRGLSVDTEGFEKAMEGQRDMARAAWSGSGEKATGKIWFELKEKLGATEFVGYDADEADGKIIAVVKDGLEVQSADAGDEVFIILDKTPFYGESGGQVGDTGAFTAHATVLDTQKPLDDFIVHKAKLTAAINVGKNVHAVINNPHRNATRANHSATHLLHKALRDLLGDHVTQKGSLVSPDRLRFDFSHTKAVSREELDIIERKVNEVVARNTPVECKIMAPDEAVKAGAMALFGEKYGDRVRVLSMGEDSGFRIQDSGKNTASPESRIPNLAPYSVELCGGTHVRATGDIGLFKITSEGSVASGIRRIEAVTGEGVRNYFEKELQKLNEQLQKLREENARLVAGLSGSPLPEGGRAREGALLTSAFPSPLPNPPPQAGEGIASAGLKELPSLYEKQSGAALQAIQALQDENKKLTKRLAETKKQQALGSGGEIKPEKIGSVNFIGKLFEGLDPKELRPLAEEYSKQADVVALATNVEGKASVVVAVAKSLTDKISAVTLVQAAVTELGGKGGGGRPEMAQGGGPEAGKLDAALATIKRSLG